MTENFSELMALELPQNSDEIAHLPVDQLCQAIGNLRALKTKLYKPLPAGSVPDVPQSSFETASRTTTSRHLPWCKVAKDGYTPVKNKPSMVLNNVFYKETAAVTERTWRFLDQFNLAEDDAVEEYTIRYPCNDLERVARDLTRSWQLYNTPDLDKLDAMILANTPVAVEVDGMFARRYLDIWASGNPSRDCTWHVHLDKISRR